MWTIFLGFSSLIWGQLVLTVPKKSFPKLCRFGRGGVPLATIVEPDGSKDSRARLLWIRGLTRLQHQVRFVLFWLSFSGLTLMLCDVSG
jgi:Ca2+ transporting ATPase